MAWRVFGCVVAALSLQGCFLESPPPRSCFQIDIENGKLPLTSVNDKVDTESICDEGYEYVGEEFECGWIDRECKLEEDSSGAAKDAPDEKESEGGDSKKDGERRLEDDEKKADEKKANPDSMGGRNPQCQEVFGFLEPDSGLKSWPEGQPTKHVEKFTHTWEAYLKAASAHYKDKAASGAGHAAAAAKEAASKAKDAASKVDVKGMAEKASSAAGSAASSVKEAASGALSKAKAAAGSSSGGDDGESKAKESAETSSGGDDQESKAKEAAESSSGSDDRELIDFGAVAGKAATALGGKAAAAKGTAAKTAAAVAKAAKAKAAPAEAMVAKAAAPRRLSKLPASLGADAFKGKCVKKAAAKGDGEAKEEAGEASGGEEKKFLVGKMMPMPGNSGVLACIGAAALAMMAFGVFRSARADRNTGALLEMEESDAALD